MFGSENVKKEVSYTSRLYFTINEKYFIPVSTMKSITLGLALIGSMHMHFHKNSDVRQLHPNLICNF